MEARIDREEAREPEAVVRQRRQKAVDRDEAPAPGRASTIRGEATAARRGGRGACPGRFPSARDLESMGKVAAAIDVYRAIARMAPGSEEGRQAAERIARLVARTGPR